MPTLAIDIETYSSADIKYGVYRYVDSPDFEILLFAYSFDDDPVQVIDLTAKKMPAHVERALFAPNITKTAFNANFEITCLKKYYPNLPDEQWECTSVLALYNSLPTSLDKVAKALKLEDKKDTKGKALIRYFSTPCKPTKTNGGRTRNMPKDAPDKWKEYIEYNRQDVVVEKSIRKKLIRLKPPKIEHDLWLLDRQINDNGAMINQQLVNNAISLSSQATERLIAKAKEITGLDNPNSVAQLKRWLEARIGNPIESLNKKTIAEALKGDLPDDVRTLLLCRQQMGKTSVKKYESMQNAVTSKGRIHGMFQFYGAVRTGRWAGRVVQLHNLPRNTIGGKELDAARALVLLGDIEALELCFGNVPDTLSQLIRTAIEASPGHRFIVDDFSAIEARVIAWLAGEKWRQEVFAKGGDIYCASASAMFHVPVEKHGINGHLRQKGKIAELALGYQGGTGALKAMGADKIGLTDEELEEIVAKWRNASPHIVRFWYDVDAAAKRAIKEPGKTVILRNLKFYNRYGALFIELPSGRRLSYINPKLGLNRFGSETIVHKGVGINNKWEDLETYGGKLAENIVQATARDCLAAAMMRLAKAGYKIIMHVHDEVVMEMPEGKGNLDEVTRIMSMNEPWERGLIKNADGFESNYYMKD